MADIHKPLSIVAHAAIAVGIAFTLVQAWFFFWSDPEVAPMESRAAAPAVASRDIPIDRIKALDLFGKAATGSEQTLTGREATEELRETRLSLTLAGVVVADEPSASTAFIAQRGRRAETFGIGDRLPGNAKLEEVYQDRVVLSRGGMRERLRLEEQSGGRGGIVPNRGRAPVRAAPRAAPTPPGPGPRTVQSAARSGQAERRAALAAIRERLESRPEEALEELGIDEEAVVAEGGYVVGTLADHPALRGMGLTREDRILSVNGRSLGEIDDAREALSRIVGQGSASVEIQRGERRFVVTVAL